MNTDYMKIFTDVFYDVEKDEEMNNVIKDSCNLIGSVIFKYGEIINEMRYKQPEDEWVVDTVIMLYIRKIIEHLDAINILIEKCAFTQATIILRTLLESTVGLKFILKEDTEKRAAAYYLYHHYEEIGKMKDFDENTNIGKILKKNMGEESFNLIARKCKDKKEAFERLLQSKSLFAEIEKTRKKKIKQKKQHSPQKKPYVYWYELCSPVTSFKGMMISVGWGDYYEAVYGGMSMEVHSYNAVMEMLPADDGLHMKLVRNPLKGLNVIEYTGLFAFSVLMDIYEYLKDGKDEKEEFEEYYIEYVEARDNIRNRYNELIGGDI